MKIIRRQSLLTLLLVSAVVAAWSPAAAEFDVVLDVRPGAVLVNQSGTFKATGPATLGDRTIEEIEKVSGLSFFPTIRLGGGIDSVYSYWDLTGTAGIMINDPFRSVFFGADTAWMYKYRKNVSVGPHLGLMYFPSPDWSGDGEIEFDSSWGALLGAQLTLGYDILFVFSIDYIYTEPFTATAKEGWESDKELDLSGVGLQFGMRGRF